MSKRSRQKGDDTATARPAPPPAPGTAPRRPRSRLLAVLLFLALALPAALVLARRWPASATPSAPPGPAIPELDVSSMDPPVAAAIRKAREAVVHEPSSSDTWGTYAMVLDAHKLLVPAIACYARAHELAPDEFRWAYLLALARSLNGDPSPDTLAAFEAAIRLRPGSPLVHFHHGDVLVRRAELPAARAAYERALALDPALGLAHRNLGQVLLELGDPRAAVEHLERARALVPTDRFTLATLARAYNLAGDVERAREAAASAPAPGDAPALDDPERSAVDRLAVDPGSSIDRAQRLMKLGR